MRQRRSRSRVTSLEPLFKADRRFSSGFEGFPRRFLIMADGLLYTSLREEAELITLSNPSASQSTSSPQTPFSTK